MVKDSFYTDQRMFYGASPSLFEKARYLRNNLTKTESILWEKLNRKQLGVKFRRQHPVFIYIADFYCHAIKLVIEIDGTYHTKPGQKTYDEFRSEDINTFGIEVIRFTDDQVLNGIEKVLKEIRKVIYRRTTGS